MLNDEAANTKAKQAAHAQAAQYYVQLAAKHCPEQSKRRSVKDVQPLIEAVWQYCQAALWQEAYTLMIDESLFKDLYRWGANTLLLEFCQLLQSENWQYQPLQMGMIYNHTALVYDVLGQKQQALKYHEMDLQVSREANDRKTEGTTLNNIRGVYDDLGEKGKAVEYYEQALSITREVGDRGGEGTTLWNIGAYYYSRENRNEVALACFLLAKGIFQEVQSPDASSVEKWIASLRTEMGEEPFATLLAQVELRAEQVVEEAMREVRGGRGMV